MAKTIDYTPVNNDTAYLTLAYINSVFQEIKAVLDNKLDVRDTVVERDLILVASSIINVPPATETGDVEQNGS